MISVLLVDDERIIRASIIHMLAPYKSIKVVGEAATAQEAVDLLASQNPEVIILDLKLPDMEGIDLAAKLLAINAEFKILVLTGITHDHLLYRLLELGVVGFLTKKEANTEQLVRSIKAAYTGQRTLSHSMAQRLAFTHTENFKSSPFEVLAPRERLIARMILEGSRINEVAEQLNISPKTVHTHRMRVFEKLKIQNDVQLVLLAVRYHIVQPEKEEIAKHIANHGEDPE